MVSRDRTRGFTLIELLAVVAVVAIVGVITVVAYSAVINDVRRASAVEQVKGLLAQSRTIALESGRTTMLAFRARNINDTPRVEAVIAQPAGGSVDWQVPDDAPASVPSVMSRWRVSRFVLVDGVDPVLLPENAGVAIPAHALSNPDNGAGGGAGGAHTLPYSGDLQYLPPTHLGERREAAGIMPGILFGRDGTTVTGIPEHQSRYGWIDFDGDGYQGLDGVEYSLEGSDMPHGGSCWVLPKLAGSTGAAQTTVEYPQWIPLCQLGELDEPWVTTGPFLVVYDTNELRSLESVQDWLPTQAGSATRSWAHTRYIDDYGRRLFFNRFTGVSLEEAER